MDTKKTVFIIIGVVVVIVIIGFLSQILGGIAIWNAMGGKGKVNVNNGTVKINTKNGTATIGNNISLPSNWPSDVPVYSGAKIQSAVTGNAASGGSSGMEIVFQTGDSAQQLSDYYNSQLVSNGWKINGTYQTGAGSMTTATKDTRTVETVISNESGQTTVTLVVGTK